MELTPTTNPTSSTPIAPPASADISGLTPCKESKAFAKREKQSSKKLESSLKKYAPDSAPALAINASIEKIKRRFDNYGKQGLLCGADGLPHLIVSGDQHHWGEFVTLGVLFLYIAGWIGWVGRSYLIAVRDEKKLTMKEIIIDVPLASKIIWKGFIWPVAAYREFINGELVEGYLRHLIVYSLIDYCIALSLFYPMYIHRKYQALTTEGVGEDRRMRIQQSSMNRSRR
ncbi:Photosystem I reaction center subunit III [Zostera marina]|uniref:Photosystem I reaction center subunit III n=1 Tax=Zostera marina TaxID=29655 RepID=A0A0K9Q1F9_ZOSMR|nr:Photosystem I reaction center subunit III [Zostera marina]